MEPFWEKLILMFLDKGLLALMAGVFAYFASRALERYRRNQAVTLELGKARAAAFLRVRSCLGACDFLVACLEVEGGGVDSERSRDLLAQLETARAALWAQLTKDFGLLDDEAGAAALKYQRALTAGYVIISKGGSMRGGREEAELDEARQELERLLPPLRPSD
ncbi:hypothetical protein [Pyxidicoccus sp. MSG2]|uniref:hypothetical protein n=1 Tax=Pyxidicoccus sp. MSG2 TaxID=2996790 RepID=UPI0022711F7F|nr:hypothetical protein [Pyxidicoccus sp. MSG2]MCY1022353.1 hypothetical protein [Pyxidicoccus sp. MSG2]